MNSVHDLKKSHLGRVPHYLVVGNPIGHSLSPLMHGTALKYHGIAAEYHAVNVLPNELPEFTAWCNRDSFLGCNITIPYKEQFFELLDHADESALEIGAINTIGKKSGKLIGYNTDIYGFISPINDLSHLIEGGRAIVFGTGGASKAIKAGLKQLGIDEIIFVSRNPSARKISDDFVHIEITDYSQWQAYADDASIFVNTTPVGMYPDIEKSIIDSRDVHLMEGKICYDLIYNPEMTAFLKQAESVNAVVINGLDMFIQQGNHSFQIWTGKTFPEDLIKEELYQHLHKQ